jgi:hypothetical protein
MSISLYRTSDLYFASFLKTKGAVLQGTEKEDFKITFIFEDDGSIKELKREYFNRQGHIIALDFVDEIRSMKSLTYMSKKDS